MRGIIAMAIIITGITFGTSAKAVTNEEVRQGLITIAQEVRLAKAETCTNPATKDRSACEKAFDDASVFADAMSQTVPILNMAREDSARALLFKELDKRLAIAKPFELAAKRLSQR